MLEKLDVAIVLGHTIRRITSGFLHDEKTRNFELLNKRIRKMLLSRESKNFKVFANATEIERVVWMKTTKNFNGSTPIFAVDFVVKLYDYFEDILKRYANISPKLMDKIAQIHMRTISNSETCIKLEENDNSLLASYIKNFESYSGVGLKKSPFQGKKNILKNTLLIEGKEVKKGF